MKRYLMLAALGLALASTSAAAQESAATRIETARRSVVAAGIPASLIETRIAEGRAKGIPLDRIAAVVEQRAAALLEARRGMAGAHGLGAADLGAGADAVEAGIDADALRSVIAGARDQDRPVAIAVLTYLHREGGLPVGQALARVRAAMAKGPDALRTLPAKAAAEGRHGPRDGVGEAAWVGKGKHGGGPPAAVPGPGHRPGAGKPDHPGKGPPGGKPGGGRPGGGH
jgi:hypothetical protein